MYDVLSNAPSMGWLCLPHNHRQWNADDVAVSKKLFDDLVISQPPIVITFTHLLSRPYEKVRYRMYFISLYCFKVIISMINFQLK